MLTCQSVQARRIFCSLGLIDSGLFPDIYYNRLVFYSSFQLPAFLSKVQSALGLPAVQDVPVAGPSSAPPVIAPLPSALLEHSESDEEVQTLAVPVRSGSSEAFLPMVTTDDSWSSDTEFRFVSLLRHECSYP